jgi:hypothetical protein
MIGSSGDGSSNCEILREMKSDQAMQIRLGRMTVIAVQECMESNKKLLISINNLRDQLNLLSSKDKVATRIYGAAMAFLGATVAVFLVLIISAIK